MSDYEREQMDDLAALMPTLMAYLRTRREAGDAEAGAYFEKLDSWCWHQPLCSRDHVCENGKPQRFTPEVEQFINREHRLDTCGRGDR